MIRFLTVTLLVATLLPDNNVVVVEAAEAGDVCAADDLYGPLGNEPYPFLGPGRGGSRRCCAGFYQFNSGKGSEFVAGCDASSCV